MVNYYLLDTNACIKYLAQKNSPILRKFATIPKANIVLCDIVKFEMYYGAYKSSCPAKNLAVLDDLINNGASASAGKRVMPMK